MVEPNTESPAARLIDALLDGGEAIDEGQFSLDPAAAAAKLEQFAYADRSGYLIPITEGLLGLGAREIELETRGEDLLIRASGMRIEHPEDSFVELYTHALGLGGDPRTRALGRLAIGLDMVLGDEACKQVRLRYSSPSGSVTGVYRRRVAPAIERGQPEVIGELELLIDHAWIRRPDTGDVEPALDRLRAAVRFAAPRIRLDGAPLSQQPREWLETLSGEGPGYRFRAGLEQARDTPAVIELWSAGVCVDTRGISGEAFTAVVELELARRDLSQTKVVRDEVVERALLAVEQARTDALARLEQADAGWTPETRPAAWPAARVDRLLGRVKPWSRAHPRDSAPLASRSTNMPARSRLGLCVRFPGASARTPVALFLLLVSVPLALLGLSVLSSGTAAGVVMLLGPAALAWIACYGLMSPYWSAARRALDARDHGRIAEAVVTRSQPLLGLVSWSFVDAKGVPRSGRSLRRDAGDVSEWVPGREITVYYHSDDPAESWWEADVGPRGG